MRAIDILDGSFGMIAGAPNLGMNLAGILYTMDGGNTWLPVISLQFNPALPSWTQWRAINIVDQLTAYVAGDSALVYKTTDGGVSWEQCVTNAPNPATIRDIRFFDADNGIIVGGDRRNPPFLGYPPLIMRTGDGGLTWTDESPAPFSIPGDPPLTRIDVDMASGTWAVSGELGTVLYNNSGLWTRLNYPGSPTDTYTGINVFGPNDFVVTGNDGAMLGPTKPKIFRTSNGGVRWFNYTPVPLQVGATTFGDCHFFSPSYGWTGANTGYLIVTTDGGMTWTPFSSQVQALRPTMLQMDFVDSLNGWAIGEDWILRYYGVPPKSDISTSQTNVTFPDIACEPYVEAELSLRNSGTGVLIIDSLDVTFSDNEYSFVGVKWPIKILPRKGLKVIVRWTPSRTTSGAVGGSISIGSNDPDHNPFIVSLAGTRFYGVLAIDTPIDFGAGICLRDSTIFAANGNYIGNRPPTFISLTFISGNNEFTLVSPAIGTVINSQRPFVFRFKPLQPGPRQAIFRVVSGDPGCPDTSYIQLQGFGDWTKTTASSTEIDFGKVCVNALRDTSITIRNIGNTYALVTGRELKSGVDMFPSLEDIPILIYADSTKKYRLRFAPQLSGSFDATYRIHVEPCRDTIVIRLKGEGIETKVGFVPAGGVTVGPTIVNRLVSRTVTVRNTGQTPANITSVRLAKFFPELRLLNLPPLPLLLQPGESFEVEIEYHPSKLGTILTTLDVAWNSVCPDTAKLDIEAPCLPNPQIDPPLAMDLGVQACPKAIRDTLFIRNKGNGPLVFYSSTIVGVDRADFKVIAPVVGDSVRANDSTRFIIEYNRSTEGSSTAGVYFSHNDADRMPTYIALSARRTVAEFTVSGDSATAFFTRLFVPERRTFTVTNSSNQPISISAIDFVKSSAVFTVENLPAFPKALSPGQSFTFDVVFTPNARGPFTVQVRITSLPCQTTALVTLTGSGDTDGLSIDKGNIDYDLDPCSFAALCDTLRLSNQGKEPVSVLSFGIAQAENVFSIFPAVTVPLTLNPGEERAIRICADPTLMGRHTATLTITSNDPAYPTLTVLLVSNRDSSSIRASVAAIDFGRLAQCDDSVTRNITVSNAGLLKEVVSTRLASGIPAYVSTGGADITLLPGKSFSFNITFSRTAFGVFDDTVLVSYERCPNVIRIPLHGEWIEQVYAAVPNPVVFPPTNVGSSVQRSLNLQNNGGFDGHIASISIAPPGQYSVLPGYADTMIPGSSQSVQIQFTPTLEGNAPATACVIFDTPCRDTVCVQLDGSGIRGSLSFSPVPLDFGTRAQCETVDLNDTLRNDGTGPITIVAAAINGPGQSAFVNLTPISTPEVIGPGTRRIFTIRHTAAQSPADGAVNATLSVTTNDALQPTIDLPLEAERVTQAITPNGPIAFGVVESGIPVQRTITLTNTGSVRYCYSTDRKPSYVTYTPPLPICLDPGATAQLIVTLTPPPVPGALNTGLALVVATPCADSTVLALSATVQQGSLTQTSTADFDSGPWCVPVTRTIQIINLFLNDVTLDSLQLSAPDGVFFTVTSPATLPQTIASGSTLTISVTFTGTAANRTYASTLTSVLTSLGQRVVLQTSMTGATIAGSMDYAAVAFPQTVIGQPTSRTTTVTNTSPVPIRITAVTIPDPAFVVTGTTPPLPATLQPGETLVVQLSFAPTQARAHLDSISVIADQPCDLIVKRSVTGTAIPFPIVQTSLSIGTIEGRPDDIVRLPLLVDQDLGTSGVTAWSGSLQVNRTMLYPLRVVNAGALSAGMNVAMTYDPSTGVIGLSATGGTVAAGTGALAYVECQVLIGNDAQCPITISQDFDFTAGYAHVESRIDGVFILTGYCRIDSRLVDTRSFTLLNQNIPNPVSASTTSSTLISYRLENDEDVELLLMDGMGRVAAVLDRGLRAKGRHEVRLDVSRLPAGVYYYTLRTQHYTGSRKLQLLR